MKGSSMIMTIGVLIVVALVAVLAMPPKQQIDNMVPEDINQEVVEETVQEVIINNETEETKIMETQQFTKATMETSAGTITLELFSDKAPNTVANFGKLASEGFYDGTRFHRVIADFMIQSGDPQSKDESMSDAWGTGGPGYTFEDEIHAENNNVIGTISMANAGPNTNGSQYFINVADNNFLDSKHTVFGRVIEGMDTVEVINTVAVDGRDRPVEEVVIISITVE